MASGDERRPRESDRDDRPRGRVARECDVLAERFLELAARLQAAVRPLRAPGSLPDRRLLDELADCRSAFLALREQARQLAGTCRIPCPPEGAIDDLHGLSSLLDDLCEAQECRDRDEEVRRRALAVLDRVVTLAHATSPNFTPLHEAQEAARRLRAAIAEGAQGGEAERLAGGSHPFVCLLTLVEDRASLSDDLWAKRHLTVGSAFDMALAASASGGLIVPRGRETGGPSPGPATPAPPSCVVVDGPLALPPIRTRPEMLRKLGGAFPTSPLPAPRPPIRAFRPSGDSLRLFS